MIRYKLYQDKRKGSATKDKWYARAVHETMTFDEFITHLATHHCAFSESAIRGVLIETENCLRELLLGGKAVHLDDLGIFRIGLKTTPADSTTDFNPRVNVTGCRLNLYLGKRFLASNLRKDMKIKEADVYTVQHEDEGDDDNQNP